jgi:hypothetical protein
MGAFLKTSNAGVAVMVVVAVLTDLDCDGDGRVLDAFSFRIENIADSVAVGDR